MSSPSTKPDNPLINLVFNIFAPVAVLKYLTAPLGPVGALVLALLFPIGYGAYDLWKKRKFNMISLLGLVNTLVTGGFALLGLTGFWFSIKEAAFPLLIGLFILFSAWTNKPAVEVLFLNPSLFHIDRLEGAIEAKAQRTAFKALLSRATIWLAVSFFLSAILNFILATSIFTSLDGFAESARSEQLNDQIAKMTQWSVFVILIPSMIFLITIFYGLLRKIRTMTGLTDDDLLKIN